MNDDHHMILPMIVYPRQVLGVPPGLMFGAMIVLSVLALVVGLITGDVLQVEVYLLYLPVHIALRRAYRQDPFIETVWRARLWDRQPWGAPAACLRRTRNRTARAGVNRFS